MRSRRYGILLGCALAAVAVGLLTRPPKPAGSPDREAVTLFVAHTSGTPILLPTDSTAAEREAAELLAGTLAHASRLPQSFFPIRPASGGKLPLPAFFIGPRVAGGNSPAPLEGARWWRETVGYQVSESGVRFLAHEPDQLSLAVSVFLERTLRARWFMPGPQGLETDHPRRFQTRFETVSVAPGYLSRDLNLTHRDSLTHQWAQANRLRPFLAHGHNVAQLLGDDLRSRHPELIPLRDGQRLAPGRDERSWQPVLTHPQAAWLAAKRLSEVAARRPEAFNVVFGLNDSFRFDQSEESIAALAPHRYFRRMPDYSPLLFGFMNRLAALLPEQNISTYAYYWTENAPDFPVAPNVIPVLTADRSMWCDPDFARQDKALIERWVKAGPRMVALYDYLYGHPFVVPRPTLWAVTEPIPYAYQKGVRAYFAETNPNWGLDGPKLWLAAQLLWEPQADAGGLVAEYYERFWKEAAGPMQEFFAGCDRQWREQPSPLIWIKYFVNDHQRVLFPSAVRKELRKRLEEASSVAQSPVVRARVALVSAAFALTESFCAHDEIRQDFSRELLSPSASVDAVLAHWQAYAAARRHLVETARTLRQQHPLAMGRSLLGNYLRSDPRRQAAIYLLQQGAGERIPASQWEELFGATPQWKSLAAGGREMLFDPAWRGIRERTGVHPFALTAWLESDQGAWHSRTEPWESRRLSLTESADGERALVFGGCSQEAVFQWCQVEPGSLYVARVRFRGRVSPENFTVLSLSFVDRAGRPIGNTVTHRVPLGEWEQAVELSLAQIAPPGAAKVGYTLSVLRQAATDEAEFSRPSLLELRRQ